MSTRGESADTNILQSRLAARLAAALGQHAAQLPHDLSERLRFGRELALVRARASRHPLAEVALGLTAQGGVGSLLLRGGGARWWQLAASVLPLLVLVAGLVLIDRFTALEQVQAAADIDAQLLADDLPPEAYSDAGFAEFLRSPPP